MNIQPVKVEDRYPNAFNIVKAEWGAEYAAHFVEEITSLLIFPGNCLYGCYSESGELLGFGLITKDQIDYALWGISWVVVRKDCQRAGIGSRILTALESYAGANQGNYPTGDCLILLTTTIPDFYLQYGYETIKKWNVTNLMIKAITSRTV